MRYFFILIVLLFVSCQSSEETDQVRTEENTGVVEDDVVVPDMIDTSISENNYTTQSIHSEEVGWGYQILNNGKPYINQPHIPAVSGAEGFNSEEDALKTADLVLYKLENGIVPPSVTIEELDSLGVLNK